MLDYVKDLCLGDFVWYDKNLNGLQDEGEAGIVGIEVQLLTLDNTPAKDIYGREIEPIKTNGQG